MIGDAPGDRKAAEDNGILFFPVRPLDEIRSWEEFQQQRLSTASLPAGMRAMSSGGSWNAFPDAFRETPPWIAAGQMNAHRAAGGGRSAPAARKQRAKEEKG